MGIFRVSYVSTGIDSTGSDSQESNSTAILPAPKPGGRKSARLVLTKTQLHSDKVTPPADESSSIEAETQTQETDSSMVPPSKTDTDTDPIEGSMFGESAVAGTTSTSQLLCMAEE